MKKIGIVVLLTMLSTFVFANPSFYDRQGKEFEKIAELKYKFQPIEYTKICKVGELPSECFKNKIASIHKADKLTVQGMAQALPAGIELILIEKDKFRGKNPKKTSSVLNLESNKKQAEMVLFFIELSCSAATPKDWGVVDQKIIDSEKQSADKELKGFRTLATEKIEQVRKYSNADSDALKVRLAVACSEELK